MNGKPDRTEFVLDAALAPAVPPTTVYIQRLTLPPPLSEAPVKDDFYPCKMPPQCIVEVEIASRHNA